MPKQKRPTMHWTSKQDLNYYFFLILHYDILQQNRKETQLYKKMSTFIMNKSFTQCRTHHDKKLVQIKNHYGDKQLQLFNLYKFYHENYKLRRLDQDYLKYQLQCFLHQIHNLGLLNERKFKDHFLMIDSKLEQLQLQKKCLSYYKVQTECQTEIMSQILEKLPSQNERQKLNMNQAEGEQWEKVIVYFSDQQDKFF